VAGAHADQIQLEDVLAHVRFDGALSPHAGAGTLRSARQQFERDYIAFVLQHHRGRVGDAARALGIQRTNLYRKARQLGIRLRQGHNS
jgi:DNA-binding NtrC family response regulator